MWPAQYVIFTGYREAYGSRLDTIHLLRGLISIYTPFSIHPQLMTGYAPSLLCVHRSVNHPTLTSLTAVPAWHSMLDQSLVPLWGSGRLSYRPGQLSRF